MFEVVLCFPIILGCAGLFSRVVHHVFVFFVSSSLTAVASDCGGCFSWFYVVLSCFTMFFGELLQLMFCCFKVLNIVSKCMKSLWFGLGCFLLFSLISDRLRMFQCFFCSKHVRSPNVGSRGFNLFIICATLFYVVSSRFSASECQVVFGCFRIFRLFMMYKSCWRFLGRLG